MSRLGTAVKYCLLSSAFASHAFASELVVRLYKDDQPLANAEIQVNGQVIGVSDNNGHLFLNQIAAGAHKLSLMVGDERKTLDVEVEEDKRTVLTLFNNADDEMTIRSMSTGLEKQLPLLGRLVGVVRDENQVAVGHVQIRVQGQTEVFTANEEGEFSIEISAGKRTIEFMHPEQDFSQIAEVYVIPSMEKQLLVTLEQEVDNEVESIAVVGVRSQSTLGQEREASAVVDVMDASLIKRVGDSEVSSALAKVTGVSLEDDRFAVVRGLKGRYVTVTLNNARFAGTDPYRRDIALDMFPSFILDQLQVQKSYTADKHGESTAASVNISTVLVPERTFFDMSYSAKHVDNTSGKRVLTHGGSDTDWLGYDDGLRDRPQIVRDTTGLTLTGDTDLQALNEQVAESFVQRNEVSTESAPMDMSLSMSGGSKFDLGNDSQMGFLLGYKYSNTWESRTADELLVEAQSFTEEGSKEIKHSGFERGTVREQRTTNSIKLGTVAALTLELDDAHQLTVNNFIVRDSDKVTDIETTNALFATGNNDVPVTESDVDPASFERDYNATLEWTERQSVISQLLGNHDLEQLDGSLSWFFSASRTRYEQPDKIAYRFALEDSVLVTGDPSRPRFQGDQYFRSYEDLTEEVDELGLRYDQLVFENSDISGSLAVGFDRIESDRQFTRFTYGLSRPVGFATNQSAIRPCGSECDIDKLNPDHYLTPAAFGASYFFDDLSNEGPRNIGLYNANYSTLSEFVTASAEWFDVATLSLGIRRENFEQSVSPYTQPRAFPAQVRIDVANDDIDAARLDEDHQLRAVNATYFITDDLQLRYAYSETVARPSLTESADGVFRDEDLGLAIRGNPGLKVTEIRNLDYRLEYYFARDEAVSLSYFRKYFNDPIVLAFASRARETGNEQYQYRNGESGFVHGGEVEARTAFDIGDDALFLQFNYAKLSSELYLVTDSIFQGGDSSLVVRSMSYQPEYIANLIAGYDHSDWGLSSTLVYNKTGRKFSRVERAELSLLAEEPIDNLKLLVKKDLASENWDYSVTFSVDNVLDSDYQESLQNISNFRRYEAGREYQLKFGMKFN